MKDPGETAEKMVTIEDEKVAMVLTALSGTKADVPELFEGGSFVETIKATALNLTPSTDYDLRTGFDRSDPKVRKRVWEDLERQSPAIAVGSPTRAALFLHEHLHGGGRGAGSYPWCRSFGLGGSSSSTRCTRLPATKASWVAGRRRDRQGADSLGDECVRHRSAP